MLGDLQTHRREFVHLSALTQERRRVDERGLAAPADGGAMLHDLVRQGHQVQRLATVANLPACLLPTWLAQAARFPPQPVARGWLGTGVAIPLGVSQLRFQFGVARQQLRDLLTLARHLLTQLGDQRLQFRDALLRAHAPRPGHRVCLLDVLLAEVFLALLREGDSHAIIVAPMASP
jgi:hypothetical protein